MLTITVIIIIKIKNRLIDQLIRFRRHGDYDDL